MLINLSNHPAYKKEADGYSTVLWSSEQLQMAQMLYKEVFDLPFPNIPPEYNEKEVEEEAVKYFKECQGLINSGDEWSAVHITGEHTFCFSLIQMLIKAGYTCVTSTSERHITELGDGKKITTFKFKQFRKYKLL